MCIKGSFKGGVAWPEIKYKKQSLFQAGVVHLFLPQRCTKDSTKGHKGLIPNRAVGELGEAKPQKSRHGVTLH
jgi:hypothetical protein